jgi:hypothetical protein
MFDDARAHAQIESTLMNATVPAIDLAAIRRRMSARNAAGPGRLLRTRIAVASAAAIVAGAFLTATSPALVQTVRERYIAALHAAGIGPAIPKPLPEAIRSVSAPTRVTLARARQQANFAIVPPLALPSDVVSSTILTSPLAVWSQQRNAWSVDGIEVTFAYVRADGRTFDIVASRYSALSLPVSRYIYDADDVPSGGNPNRANRKEQFAWRNGDQTLRAVTSTAIGAGEIDRIRTAMHGIPLPRTDAPSSKRAGARVERFVVPVSAP